MIYFDNAATTAMSEAAINALIEISKEQYGNPSSIYSYGRRAKEILDKSRKIIANCIGAEADEIYFTSGGTESDNLAIRQAENGFDNIITSQIEHHAVLHAVEYYSEKIPVTYLRVNKNCVVEKSTLKEKLVGKKSLVSIMLQNNETGAIQDIQTLANMVHEDNPESLFHTDAVQAVGHMKIDVKELGVDLLSASAHKFNGPKGVGFLYVKKGCNLIPLVQGGGQEKGIRSGTENVAGIYSMAKALEDNLDCLREKCIEISRMEKKFLSLLREEKIEFEINGDGRHRASGILNISIKNIDGEGLLNMLDLHSICISIGSACNSKSKNRSHVLMAMDMAFNKIDSSVRISMGRYNTENDILELVKNIKRYYRLIIL